MKQQVQDFLIILNGKLSQTLSRLDIPILHVVRVNHAISVLQCFFHSQLCCPRYELLDPPRLRLHLRVHDNVLSFEGVSTLITDHQGVQIILIRFFFCDLRWAVLNIHVFVQVLAKKDVQM